MLEAMKICIKCGTLKREDEFYSGYVCKACKCKQSRNNWLKKMAQRGKKPRITKDDRKRFAAESVCRSTRAGYMQYMTDNPHYFMSMFGKAATKENIVSEWKRARW